MSLLRLPASAIFCAQHQTCWIPEVAGLGGSGQVRPVWIGPAEASSPLTPFPDGTRAGPPLVPLFERRSHARSRTPPPFEGLCWKQKPMGSLGLRAESVFFLASGCREQWDPCFENKITDPLWSAVLLHYLNRLNTLHGLWYWINKETPARSQKFIRVSAIKKLSRRSGRIFLTYINREISKI